MGEIVFGGWNSDRPVLRLPPVAGFDYGVCDELLAWCRTFCGRWPCVIVGGAVRDLMMTALHREQHNDFTPFAFEFPAPQDWDVYFLGCTQPELAAYWTEHPPRETGRWLHHSNLAAEVPANAPDLFTSGSPVQICATEKQTGGELVAATDWCVSAFAYDGKNVLAMEESAAFISPGNTLRLMQVTNPISTLSRGFKFAGRYDMTLKVGDVTKLCHRVVNKHHNKTIIRRKKRKHHVEN